MDAAEEEYTRQSTRDERAWLQRRLDLQRRRGEPCVPIHRFSVPANDLLPDIPAPARLEFLPAGYVCPQLRLYSALMFTDDPQYIIVGVERTKRAIRVAARLTESIGLITAIPAKRSLGAWSKWLGVYIVVALGLVIVPPDKIVRASSAIREALGGRLVFGVYRSLCGLLEHLRAINLAPRNVMFGMYRPHGPQGESRQGPAALVECDELMTKQLLRWRSLLLHSAGISVKRALLRGELDGEPQFFIDVSSDACLSDVAIAGIGGFCHGLFWYLPVPKGDRSTVFIGLLELIGVCANVLVFHSLLRTLITRAERSQLTLRTDALTSALALPAESLRRPAMRAVYDWVRRRHEWQELLPYLAISHGFGEGNPASDLISRAKWREFRQLCSQLGIRPHQEELPPSVHALFRYAVKAASEQRMADAIGGVGEQPLHIHISEALPHQMGGDFALAKLRASSSPQELISETAPAPSRM
ncbi:MAG: hypothetical protein SGPRY_002412, partial [Prymnesium sp.]